MKLFILALLGGDALAQANWLAHLATNWEREALDVLSRHGHPMAVRAAAVSTQVASPLLYATGGAAMIATQMLRRTAANSAVATVVAAVPSPTAAPRTAGIIRKLTGLLARAAHASAVRALVVGLAACAAIANHNHRREQTRWTPEMERVCLEEERLRAIAAVRVKELRSAQERNEAQAQAATAKLATFEEWEGDQKSSRNFRGAAAMEKRRVHSEQETLRSEAVRIEKELEDVSGTIAAPTECTIKK